MIFFGQCQKAATFIYMVLSGASISTQRAFIMAAVFFGAILIDRAPLSFRSFAVAMIAVVVLQPHSVMTPGFQMSFAATGALIATYIARRRRREADPLAPPAKGPVFVLKSLVVTSIVGAVATAPFAIYHFDRVAPGGILANLLAMPVITFVSAPSAGLALVAAPFGLDGIFLRVFGWSLSLVLDVAHWVAGSDRSGLSLGGPVPGMVLLLVSLGMAAACLLDGWRKRMSGLGVASVMAATAWWLAPTALVHWSASGELMVHSKQAGWEKFTLRKGDGLSPLQFIDMEASDRCEAADCSFDTIAGSVALMNTPSDCPSGADLVMMNFEQKSDMACANGTLVIRWDDVATSNGVTWIQPRFGKARLAQTRCGHRKWWPCLGLQRDQKTDQS